jgi:hypothetical protein
MGFANLNAFFAFVFVFLAFVAGRLLFPRAMS